MKNALMFKSGIVKMMFFSNSFYAIDISLRFVDSHQKKNH